MDRRTLAVGSLVFGSGLVSLVYETVWQREFRLIFGASTAASAAVLAIFAAGIGVGGLVLGRRVDRNPHPLSCYARLEGLVAISAGATPALLRLIRALYVATGGVSALGTAGATLIRLVLAALVLAAPTFLIGGTFPAAARAITRGEDVGRRDAALLYGLHALGAAAGCFAATFLLIEVLGQSSTIVFAALVNLGIAVVANSLARTGKSPASAETAETSEAASSAGPPGSSSGPGAAVSASARPARVAGFAAGASAVTGFVFFLMELVWFRVLTPLLGGSVYSFGLLLATALLGIGAGGYLYARVGGGGVPNLGRFAATALLEALAVIAPFALGDRLALFQVCLRPLVDLGLGPQLVASLLIVTPVVFPAALVAGYQFPLLIALLGGGGHHIGREVGLASALNTLGAVLGALAAGFLLIPALGAPGCWRLAAALLLALGAMALAADLPRRGRLALVLPLVVAGLLAWPMLLAPGPGALWRHAQIGILRRPMPESLNAARELVSAARRAVVWESDGVESSIALVDAMSLTVALNGTPDGNARLDAPTQVMLGLLGALFPEKTSRALVVGLGTGSTAGWLGRLPEIERVDVAEIEPAMAEVARRCASINAAALDNPKVHVFVGDARELLLTTRERYQVIASEPSNPFRAGIASLYTREYYQAVASRLTEDGVFVQWLQAYSIDSLTVKSVLATLGSVFPQVEIWRLGDADLGLVAARHPLEHDAARLRARIAGPPFAEALRFAWSVDDLEGVYSHFLAGPRLVEKLRKSDADLNTDDHNFVEFGFARWAGRVAFNPRDVLREALPLRVRRPRVRGAVDWARVDDEATSFRWSLDPPPSRGPRSDAEVSAAARRSARAAHRRGDLAAAILAWRAQAEPPRALGDRRLVAEALADVGAPEAPAAIAEIAKALPIEAKVCTARYLFRAGQPEAAVDELEDAFRAYRRDPTPNYAVMGRALELAEHLGALGKRIARRLAPALKEPFALRAHEEARIKVRLRLAHGAGLDAAIDALHAFEPNVPWERDFLVRRRDVYGRAGDPLADQAQLDLERFLDAEPVPFNGDLTGGAMPTTNGE